MENFKVISGRTDISLVESYFGNSKRSLPWEWFFVMCMQSVELVEDSELAYKFMIFVKEYYPGYKWFDYDPSSFAKTIDTELKFCGFAFSNMTEHRSSESIALPRAYAFSAMVMDFLIRYRSYTLIKEDSKVIVTALPDAEEAFRGYLSEGYSIQKMDETMWVELPKEGNSLLTGVFRPLPNMLNRPVMLSSVVPTVQEPAIDAKTPEITFNEVINIEEDQVSLLRA